MDNFSLLDPRKGSDYLKVVHSLCAPEEIRDGLGPARNVLKALFGSRFLRGGKAEGDFCQTVVREDDYVDEDFLDSYTRFYYLSHKPVPRHTTRFHFFSRRLDEDQLFHIDQHRDSYIGFIVCRPTHVNRIGKTVLCLPERNENEYVLCAAGYDVHLFGTTLRATGPMLMEQDAQVSRCASAAVYVATRYMAQRFGTNFRSTREISDLASRLDPSQGRGIPSRGLSTRQIAEVLGAMQYDAVVYGASMGTTDVKRTIYRVVESEIPVILTFKYTEKSGAHAVVVVGHGFNTRCKIRTKYGPSGSEYFSSADLVDYFLVSDDRRGPSQRFMLENPDKGGNAIIKIEDADGKFTEGELQSIVVPFPRGIWLDAERSEGKAHTLVTRLCKELLIKPPTDMVLRTYLRPSNEFKATAAGFDKNKAAFQHDVGARLRVMRTPKYVWIAEITSRKGAKAKTKVGEIVLDPSGSLYEEDFLAMHIGGYWVTREGKHYVSAQIPTYTSAYPMFERQRLSCRVGRC